MKPQAKLNPFQRPIKTEPSDNPKHEALAQCLARGMTQAEAYVGAGYSPKNANAGCAALLRQNPWIKDRVKTIQASERQALERARPDLMPLPTYMALEALAIGKERILAELWDNAMIGKGKKPAIEAAVDEETGELLGAPVYEISLAASNAALIAIGKELGMFVDGGKNQPEPKDVIDVESLSDEQLAKLEQILDNVNHTA